MAGYQMNAHASPDDRMAPDLAVRNTFLTVQPPTDSQRRSSSAPARESQSTMEQKILDTASTTLMLHGVPPEWNYSQVVELLEHAGFEKTDFDYMYTPADNGARKPAKTMGYMFVNFKNPETAARLAGLAPSIQLADRTLRVTLAAAQGVMANLLHFARAQPGRKSNKVVWLRKGGNWFCLKIDQLLRGIHSLEAEPDSFQPKPQKLPGYQMQQKRREAWDGHARGRAERREAPAWHGPVSRRSSGAASHASSTTASSYEDWRGRGYQYQAYEAPHPGPRDRGYPSWNARCESAQAYSKYCYNSYSQAVPGHGIPLQNFLQ